MGNVIAVVNQKGGVGKSTTTVNLAAYLGTRDKKILCFDLDAQGNATTGFGIRKKDLTCSAYEVLSGKASVKDAILMTEFENISLVPADADLAGVETELVHMDQRFNRLKMQLLTIKQNYDYIFIDCPPALSQLTINAMTAADALLIPMLAEYYALEGLTQLVNTKELVQANYNPKLKIAGILFTMYDNRLNLSRQVVEEVERYFPGQVFQTKIPRNVRLSEAPSYGKPILYYDKHSKGSLAYEILGKEFLGEPLSSLDKLRMNIAK